MAIEAGGKNGVIPADGITTDYVDARNAGNKPYEIFHADSNVRQCGRFICHAPAFVKILHFEVSQHCQPFRLDQC